MFAISFEPEIREHFLVLTQLLEYWPLEQRIVGLLHKLHRELTPRVSGVLPTPRLADTVFYGVPPRFSATEHRKPPKSMRARAQTLGYLFLPWLNENLRRETPPDVANDESPMHQRPI